MNNEDISRMLRSQAWERAKGELKSMLCTFHGTKNARDGQFEQLDERLEAFIKDVENNGLDE